MRTFKIINLFLLHYLIFSASIGFAQPTLPRSKIPADIPPDIKEKIIQLYSPDAVKRGYAINDLAKKGNLAAPAVPFLLSMLIDTALLHRTVYSGSMMIRMEFVEVGKLAGEAAGIINDQGLEGLLVALKNKNAQVRVHVVYALGELKAQKAYDLLIDALQDPVDDFRSEAAWALGNFNNSKAVVPLLDRLKNDKSSKVRVNAAAVLGLQLASTQVIPHLLTALKDSNPNVRGTVAVALGNLKAKEAVEPLINALHDKDAGVRRSVSGALYKITGYQGGENHQKWQAWWNENSKNFTEE